MPVAFAIEAMDRSISAQRMTKVRPTAMMPATEICVRMLATLSMERKDGLAIEKKTSSTMRVANGAMLRIWVRRKTPRRERLAVESAPSIGTVIKGPSSRGFEQPVLADRFAGEF